MNLADCLCVPQGAPIPDTLAVSGFRAGHAFKQRAGTGEYVIVCETCGGQCQPDPDMHVAYVNQLNNRRKH